MRNGVVPGIGKSLVSLIAVLLTIILGAPRAESAVGDVNSFNIPNDAQCNEGSDSGDAVAVVQGSKVGVTGSPILLVTSCLDFGVEEGDPEVVKLFFTDPGNPNNGGPHREKELNTIFIASDPNQPDTAWLALALRGDTGDLLACGRRFGEPSRTVLYTVDISVFNTTPDGTATYLRDGPAGSNCNGLAWDQSDKSIFMTSSGNNVVRIATAGPSAGTVTPIASGCPDGTSPRGISVAGPSLFVGCRPFDIGLNTPSTMFASAPGPGGPLRGGEYDYVPDDFREYARSLGVVQVQLPAGPSIRQLNKATGAFIRNVPGAGIGTVSLGDFECDPVNFGLPAADVMWVKDPTGGAIAAVQLPAGTCSLSGTIPLISTPGACPVHPVTNATYPTNLDGSPLDTDGDALPDCWEDPLVWAAGSLYVANPPDAAGQGRPGIDFDGDGIRDIILCVESNGQAGFQTTECADKNMKDVFVEFDSMAQHAVITAQITQVVTAFLNAPVANPNNNPNGIKLRIQIGDQNIPHITDVGFPPCTPAAPAGQNFDDLKKLWFGTAAERPAANDSAATLLAKEKTRSAKKLAFRYGISVHNLARAAGTSSPSGCAEVPGNDFIVALGSFGSGVHRNGVGVQDYWAGTFMHELGHTLGLRHGGFDNVNCKPNYLSIMSYPRQFKVTITDRPLDYSRQELDPLDEAAGLSEPAGIVGTPAQAILQGPGAPTPRTVHGPGTAKLPVATGGINWNSPTAPNSEQGVVIDVNNLSNVAGCDGKGEDGQQLGLLAGYNDWINLVYDFRATLDFADGSYASADEIREITEPEAKTLAEMADADGDGFPDTAGCGGAFCQIDIVPGLAGNKVLLVQFGGTTKTIVSVAVLSSPGFDAAQTVNPASLKFAGAPVSTVLGKPVCARLDVNRDHRRDLVCTFTVLGLSPGEQTALLEGLTLGVAPKAIRAEGTMTAVLILGGGDDD